MADLKLSETATVAPRHKQKSVMKVLKVQGDWDFRDKALVCSAFMIISPDQK